METDYREDKICSRLKVSMVTETDAGDYKCDFGDFTSGEAGQTTTTTSNSNGLGLIAGRKFKCKPDAVRLYVINGKSTICLIA